MVVPSPDLIFIRWLPSEPAPGHCPITREGTADVKRGVRNAAKLQFHGERPRLRGASHFDAEGLDVEVGAGALLPCQGARRGPLADGKAGPSLGTPRCRLDVDKYRGAGG